VVSLAFRHPALCPTQPKTVQMAGHSSEGYSARPSGLSGSVIGSEPTSNAKLPEKEVSLLPNFFASEWPGGLPSEACVGSETQVTSRPGPRSAVEPLISHPEERSPWATNDSLIVGPPRVEVEPFLDIGLTLPGRERGDVPGSASALLQTLADQVVQPPGPKVRSQSYRPGELLSKTMSFESDVPRIPQLRTPFIDVKVVSEDTDCKTTVVGGSAEATPEHGGEDVVSAGSEDEGEESGQEDSGNEMQRPVPPGPVDGPAVEGQDLNVGSAGHHLRVCKPCAFWNTKGCKDGKACKFCHLCEPGEKKRRKKEKSAYIRNISRWRQQPGQPAQPAQPGAPVVRPGS